MQFKYKTKISFVSIFLNLVIITGFFYLMFYSYKFKEYSKPTIVKAYENNVSVLKEEVPDSTTINPNDIYIPNNPNGLIYYIVQPGDTLSKIALNFGVTVSHIKKINKLKNNVIKPGQKLTITDQAGFIYISKGETLSQLAKKFQISKEDILEANSISSSDEWFHKGDEIFIPISDAKYRKLFPKKTYISKPHRYKNTYPSYRGKNIIKEYRYRPDVYNGFYRGQCTRFVAIKKFPYITKHKQKKLWNGNARYWYAHAKAKGYKVGKIPKVGSIVVIKIGGARYYYAGHVAIVKKIDRKHKRLLVEEMNALGKYIVTFRWIPINREIIGYIYI